MRSFVILSDTTCDLSDEVRKEFGIELLKAHYKGPDGHDKVSFLNWDECKEFGSSDAFFKALKSNPSKFSTSSPSIPEMAEALEKYVKAEKDVLIFAISSVMSGTYNFYQQAAIEVLNKHPEAKILVVDTLRFGAGIGLMEVNASIMRSNGLSIEEIYHYFEENRACYHQMGWLDDLSFVAKKGRITHSKAFFGQLIGIKPLGESNEDGLTTVLGKAKGEKAAYAAMLEYIKQTIENPSDQVMLVCHSMREKQALEYKRLLEETFNPKAIYVMECGPSCGINIGPGLMCAYYVGKKLSFKLDTETQMMEKILISK